MSVPTPYYDDGKGIVIYLGDCRDILPHLPKVDLVLTDPPFGTQELGGGYGRRQLHSVNGRDGRTITNDSDLSVLAESWPLMRPLLQGRFAFIFYAPRRMPEFCDIVRNEWFGELVWDKCAPGLGYTVRYQHESIAVLKIGEPEKPSGGALISVQRFNRTDVQEHPHEKPIELLKACIEWSQAQLILDPFMGSGTTLRAAKDLGRKCIGIEIEEKYCEIAARRLGQEVLDL